MRKLGSMVLVMTVVAALGAWIGLNAAVAKAAEGSLIRSQPEEPIHPVGPYIGGGLDSVACGRERILTGCVRASDELVGTLYVTDDGRIECRIPAAGFVEVSP